MGTWGIRPFENDDAADFLGEVGEATDRAAVLARPLDHVAYSGDYLEAPDLTEAIAAAAVVGARLRPAEAQGEPGLPAWVSELRVEDFDNGLVETARKALRRAMHAENNELYELWAEAGQASEYQGEVARVLAWLGDRDD